MCLRVWGGGLEEDAHNKAERPSRSSGMVGRRWTTDLASGEDNTLFFPTAGRVGTRPRKVANFVLVVFLLSFRRGEPQGRISTASVSQTVGAVFGPRTSWSHDRTSVLNRERWAKGREERTGVGDFHALFTPRAPYSDSEGRASASFC